MSLMRLVETRMFDILRKEQGNRKSAFQLSRIFTEYETTLFSHKDHPFPVVMASIPDNELRSYIRQHIPVCDRSDYKKLLVAELSVSEYRVWHEHAVKEFM